MLLTILRSYFTYARPLLGFALAILAIDNQVCAAHYGIDESPTSSENRLDLVGVSLVHPGKDTWYIDYKSRKRITFIKPTVYEERHVIQLVADVQHLETPINTSSQLGEYIDREDDALLQEKNWKVIKREKALVTVHQQQCMQRYLLVQYKEASGLWGRKMLLEDTSYYCMHPDHNQSLVQIAGGQKYDKTLKPMDLHDAWRTFSNSMSFRRVEHTKSLAESGDIDAMTELGHNYLLGIAAPESATEAVKWYTKAAKLGLPTAQYYLSILYGSGYGVDKNDEKSLEWLTESATNGYAVAQYELGRYYWIGEDLPLDYQKTLTWWRKAANQGYPRAQAALATMYALGKGVEKSDSEYAKWLEKAANQGLTRAQYALCEARYSGFGIEEDKVVAYKWCLLATSGGVKEGAELEVAIKAVRRQVVIGKQIGSSGISKARKMARQWQYTYYGITPLQEEIETTSGDETPFDLDLYDR